jgi:hypothetical protein
MSAIYPLKAFAAVDTTVDPTEYFAIVGNVDTDTFPPTLALLRYSVCVVVFVYVYAKWHHAAPVPPVIGVFVPVTVVVLLHVTHNLPPVLMNISTTSAGADVPREKMVDRFDPGMARALNQPVIVKDAVIVGITVLYTQAPPAFPAVLALRSRDTPA